MVRRILLLGVLGFGALASTGCLCRQNRLPCGSSFFPGRRAILHPAGVPVQGAPIGFGGYESGPAGIGAPGCTSCGSAPAGVPYQAAPVGFNHAPHYSGSGIPHDSMLLPNPTVVPPGTGTPRIEIDPPKPMPMTGK